MNLNIGQMILFSLFKVFFFPFRQRILNYVLGYDPNSLAPTVLRRSDVEVRLRQDRHVLSDLLDGIVFVDEDAEKLKDKLLYLAGCDSAVRYQDLKLEDMLSEVDRIEGYPGKALQSAYLITSRIRSFYGSIIRFDRVPHEGEIRFRNLAEEKLTLLSRNERPVTEEDLQSYLTYLKFVFGDACEWG